MSPVLRQALLTAGAILLLCPPSLRAQPPLASPQHARDVVHRLELGSPTRILIDLDGPWQYSADGESWNTLTLPSAFEDQAKFQLRKTFTLGTQHRRGTMWSFVGLGINYQCDVIVNDQFISHHVGGYTSCIVPIPDYALHDGENSIKLIGSNELGARETAPSGVTTFSPKNYGGMYRSAALVGFPSIAINEAEIHVTADHDRTADVTANLVISAGHLTLSSASDSALRAAPEISVPMTVRAEILDPTGTQVLASASAQHAIGDFRTVSITLSLPLPSPHWWSNATPTTYTLRCSVIRDTNVVDVFSLPFGVRTFEINGSNLLLNGSPFELKGVVYHEDQLRYGSAVDYSALEQDMQVIKTLGANAIRLEHPASPLLLTLCDEYGLLVFEQVPTIGVPGEVLNTQNYISLSKNNLQSLILRDRHHPCIVAWGLGSRLILPSGARSDYLEQLIDHGKSYDSRPTFCTMLASTLPARGPELYFLDLFGLDAADVASRVHEWRVGHATMPMIVASYGKLLRPDNHNGYSDPLSVEAHARHILTCFNALRQEQSAGGFINAYADWRSDRPSILTVETNPYVNFAGLLSYGREERRLSYDVAKALFTNDKIPTIIVGEDPASAPVIYVIIGLVFLLLLVYLANNSRRFRENFSRAIFRPFNFFADIRDQRILSTVQTTMLGVITAGTFAIFMSSIMYYLRMSPGFDAMLNVLLPNNTIKYRVAQLVWSPVECVIVLTLLLFTALIVLTALLRFCAVFVRPRIFFGDAYTIVLWAGLPTIIMIPISMILYRVMMFGPYVVTAILLGFAVQCWIAFRMLRGTAVVFDVPFRRVYLAALGVVVAAAAATMYVYDNTTALVAQFHALYQQLMS